MYLYRAVNSEDNTIDFYLSQLWDKQTASILSGVEAMHMMKKGQLHR